VIAKYRDSAKPDREVTPSAQHVLEVLGHAIKGIGQAAENQKSLKGK